MTTPRPRALAATILLGLVGCSATRPTLYPNDRYQQVGAAGGATAGLLGTMFGWMFRRSEPDPVYRNFVETCLRDKGYQPIGWQ